MILGVNGTTQYYPKMYRLYFNKYLGTFTAAFERTDAKKQILEFVNEVCEMNADTLPLGTWDDFFDYSGR